MSSTGVTGASLPGASVTRAGVTGATLPGASVTRARVTGATLPGASVTRAGVTRAGVTGTDRPMAHRHGRDDGPPADGSARHSTCAGESAP